MLNQDYTTKLLNLEDVIITNVENISDQLHISIELPRRKHTCPCCGKQTDRVHDYRTQIIKDIPSGIAKPSTLMRSAICRENGRFAN